MSWLAERYAKKVEGFKKLPPRLMYTHVLGKFVFGVGLGALLTVWLSQFDWQLLGWVLIVLSIIIAIPSLRIIWKRR